jgi:hypothetical protein
VAEYDKSDSDLVVITQLQPISHGFYLINIMNTLLNAIALFFLMGSGASSQSVACNGNAALCSRSYSNVSLVGSHDSAFVGILPTDNQLISVTDQLDDGIRFLEAQTHVGDDGQLHLCHTSCLELDAGTLTCKKIFLLL